MSEPGVKHLQYRKNNFAALNNVQLVDSVVRQERILLHINNPKIIIAKKLQSDVVDQHVTGNLKHASTMDRVLTVSKLRYFALDLYSVIFSRFKRI